MDALSELVKISGQDTRLVTRVTEAVEWIASHPDGLGVLQEAKHIHKVPLPIVVNLYSHVNGYGLNGQHNVYVNPSLCSKIFFRGDDGQKIPCSVERFCAHEFKHAAQVNALHQIEPNIRKAEIASQILFTYVPIEKYFHRFENSKNNLKRLMKLLAEIYDKHIAPHTEILTQRILSAVKDDPILNQFEKTFEIPAINFENQIMRLKGESNRAKDYIQSVIYEDFSKEFNRDTFINNALHALSPELAEPLKSGEKIKKSPRIK